MALRMPDKQKIKHIKSVFSERCFVFKSKCHFLYTGPAKCRCFMIKEAVDQ